MGMEAQVMTPNSAMAYSTRELMIIASAREIRDGEAVFVGMRLPIAAFGVARLTYAPNAVGLFEVGLAREMPAADIAAMSKRLLAIMSHERHRLVERVDYVTSPGFLGGGDARAKLGLPGGPAAVITDRAILRPRGDDGELHLCSVHPGHSLDEVRRHTGWDLQIAQDCAETPPPTAEELSALRKVDSEGHWR